MQPVPPPSDPNDITNGEPPITVFVIDPNEMLQLAWHGLIAQSGRLLLIGSGSKVEEALRAATEGWADLVLVSDSVDGAGGAIIAGALGSSGCPAALAFSSHGTDPRTDLGTVIDTSQPVRRVLDDLHELVDALFAPSNDHDQTLLALAGPTL